MIWMTGSHACCEGEMRGDGDDDDDDLMSGRTGIGRSDRKSNARVESGKGLLAEQQARIVA